MLPYHGVFSSAFSGPCWLTGGMVGAEASLFGSIALLVAALVFVRYYRENRYSKAKARPSSEIVSQLFR